MVHGEHAPVRTSSQATRPQLSLRSTSMRPLLLLLPFGLVACSEPTMTVAPPMAPAASAALSKGGVEHSVTGSGLQAIAPGFAYTIESSVHSDASGNVS